jgi:histidinol-phosphatase (PHP family)
MDCTACASSRATSAGAGAEQDGAGPTLITVDYHTHHERCGHAQGSIEEYVQAALHLGLEEIGISDHAPIYWLDGDHPLPGSAMPRSALGSYVEEVLLLRERYAGRIRVLLGLESDYAPGFEDVYREVLSGYPFDYVIGSVHYCQGLHVYQRDRWKPGVDPAEVYREYFRLVRESARSGLFDVLGHITAIMVLGPPAPDDVLETEFDETARVLAEAGVAVEINTSGLRKGRPGPFPEEALLRRCLEAGVPVTYGSDSHQPSEVGHARDVVAKRIDPARLWRPSGRPGRV